MNKRFVHIFRQIVKTGSLSIFRVLFAGVALVWVGRDLGPSEYGKITYALAAINLLGIPFSSALNSFFVRETARITHRKNDSNALALRSFAVLAYAISWGWALTAFAVGLWLVPEIYLSTFLIAIFLIPFICAISIQVGVLRGFGDVVYAQSLEWFWQPFFYLTILAVLQVSGFMVSKWVISAILAAYGCAALIGFYRLWRINAKLFIGSICNVQMHWFSGWVKLIFVMGLGVANANLALLILGNMSTSVEVGYMGVAENIALLVSVPLSIINAVIAAPLTKAAREGDANMMQTISKKSARVAFGFTLLIIIALLIFGKSIITSMFGAAYESSYDVLIVLLAGHFFNVACGSVGLILTMSGREFDCILALVTGLLLNLVLCIFLIDDFGSIGAATASAISMIGWNVIMLLKIKKYMNFSPSII